MAQTRPSADGAVALSVTLSGAALVSRRQRGLAKLNQHRAKHRSIWAELRGDGWRREQLDVAVVWLKGLSSCAERTAWKTRSDTDEECILPAKKQSVRPALGADCGGKRRPACCDASLTSRHEPPFGPGLHMRPLGPICLVPSEATRPSEDESREGPATVPSNSYPQNWPKFGQSWPNSAKQSLSSAVRRAINGVSIAD